MKADTITAQARRLGLNPATVRYRIARGWTGSRVWEPPATRAQRNAERTPRPRPLSHPWKANGPRGRAATTQAPPARRHPPRGMDR